MSRPLGLAFLLAATTAGSVLAQTSDTGVDTGLNQGVAQPRAETPALKNVAPSVEHLLGDLGGLRTRLENHGVYLLLDGITEFAGNVSGGTRRGSTFANLDFPPERGGFAKEPERPRSMAWQGSKPDVGSRRSSRRRPSSA